MTRAEGGDGAQRGGGLVVGIGVTSRAEPAAALAAVTRALQDIRSHGAVGAASPVVAVTTWGAKADHRVIRALAQELGVAVWPHDAATLRAHDAGSARIAALTGADGEPSIGSVARAAVLACGAQPLHDKRITAGCTYVLGWRSVGVGAGSAGRDDVLPDPLRHHGDVEARDSVIDLAVNVVVPRPPSWVRAAMDAALDTVAAYPQERPVREGLAAHLGIPTNRLLLVNGAAEAFSLVAQARPWRAPLVVHPQFTEPDAALRAAARPAAHHVLDPADGFCLHPLEVPGDADLVVVGNPTNPTSRLHPARALRAIRDAGPADRMLLVDEAFMDLVPDQPQSLLAEAATGGGQTRNGSGRLCVVRSLTKAFGLAGVRAGYVVGDPDFIARLRELQPPWSVNTLALAATAAVSGSRGRAHLDFYSAGLVSQRRHLVTALSRAGMAVVPEPAGPFVLARHRNAWQLRESLRRRGISVRRGDTFPGLGSQWLRFAVRNSDTTDHVTAEIMAVCQELERSADRRPPARRSEAAVTASPGVTIRPAMTPEDSR